MKRLSVILCALALASTAWAQASIKVQAPNLVSVDEQFNVSFVISGENAPSAFEWSAGDDFQLVWGPQKGSSTSVSIINGKHTRSSETTYTYILMPRKVGKFTLPAAVATVKGEEIRSSALSIQVVSGGAQQNSQSTQSAQGSSSSSSSSSSASDMFMRLSLSKTRAVVGETLTATLKLYQRVSIAGFDDVKFPTFGGFWSQELQSPNNIEFVRESVGDVIYNSAVLRSWTLIPQKAGDIKIEPSELVCLVNVRKSNSSGGSVFDSFFQDDYTTIRKRVTAPEVTVHVSSLPAGAPASFTGGVGTFKMNAAISRDSLKAHEAASLKLTVSGKGNINLLEAPKVNFPPDFEAYDIKTTDASGTRTFEYPFIPRSHGDFTLDPVEFTYYDVSAGKYVTLRGEPMTVHVAKGAGSASSDNSGQLIASPVNRKDVRDVGSDIRYVSTSLPAFSRKGHFFVGSFAYWLVMGLLTLLAVFLFFAFRGAAARRADVAGSRRRGAVKMARRRLSQAGDYLSKDLYTAFYEELHKALLGFVSDKLSMNAFDMSKENIQEGLTSRGVSQGLADDFISLLDACEFARYSPSSGHDAMNSHYEKAVNSISAIDGNMTGKRKAGKAVASALVLTLCFSLSGRAEVPADSLWNQGVRAYSEGNWEEAESSWNAILEAGLESTELYFNVGNACFKQDKLSGAILAYERALKLDPSNADARYNLDYACASVQDKIEVVPEFFLRQWTRRICWLMSSSAWTVVGIVFFVFFLASGLLFLLSSRRGLRKTGFFSSVATLLLAITCFCYAFGQKAGYAEKDAAIVTAAVCPAKSSPSSTSSVDLFVLHEGTKVKILDRVGSWVNVELQDGRQGWLSNSNLEVI